MTITRDQLKVGETYTCDNYDYTVDYIGKSLIMVNRTDAVCEQTFTTEWFCKNAKLKPKTRKIWVNIWLSVASRQLFFGHIYETEDRARNSIAGVPHIYLKTIELEFPQ